MHVGERFFHSLLGLLHLLSLLGVLLTIGLLLLGLLHRLGHFLGSLGEAVGLVLRIGLGLHLLHGLLHLLLLLLELLRELPRLLLPRDRLEDPPKLAVERPLALVDVLRVLVLPPDVLVELPNRLLRTSAMFSACPFLSG